MQTQLYEDLIMFFLLLIKLKIFKKKTLKKLKVAKSLATSTALHNLGVARPLPHLGWGGSATPEGIYGGGPSDLQKVIRGLPEPPPKTSKGVACASSKNIIRGG